ncbi:MAG TPA: DUF1995 family protein [Candidatus Caenarcaniphilales bacterium]
MTELPQTLDEAIAQAREATQAAIAAGYSRLQVELVFPELKPMPVAEQFITLFADLGSKLKVYFPDAGAAALAKRDWGTVPFEIRGIGEKLAPIQPEDQAFVLVAPSDVEVSKVEKMCEAAGDRPCILLNPQLQNVAIVGVGYAGRQLRKRFLNTIETCYYLKPLENGAILRAYPSPWQIWRQKAEGDYELIAEETEKPLGDRLEQIFAQLTQAEKPQKQGLLAQLQSFLRTLSP